MPIVKTPETIFDGETVAAAATETQSPASDLRTAYGAVVVARVTCGGTAPTSQGYFVIEYSDTDGSDWYEQVRAPFERSASAITTWTVRIPPEVMYSRVSLENGAAQSVTLDAKLMKITTRG